MNSYNFSSIASVYISAGGWGVCLSIEAHFDESGTSGNEVTLAGYIFEKDSIPSFTSDWQNLLDRHELPFFHMVDCAHGSGVFSHLSKKERTRLQMGMMRLIKRNAVNGIVCNIRNNHNNTGKIYGNLVELAFKEVSLWADEVAQQGKVNFFFEAGATGLGAAEGFFNEVIGNPSNPLHHRYGGHHYITKEGNAGIQAADLLAWQYNNYTKKRDSNDLARLDTRALLRHPHRINDECGNTPVDSKSQSVLQSQLDKEVVYYLPSIPENRLAGASILVPAFDGTAIKNENSRKIILACTNCYRSLAEGVEVEQLRSIVIKCHCGTHSYSSGKRTLNQLVRPN